MRIIAIIKDNKTGYESLYFTRSGALKAIIQAIKTSRPLTVMVNK